MQINFGLTRFFEEIFGLEISVKVDFFSDSSKTTAKLFNNRL